MSAFEEPSRPYVQIYGNNSDTFDLTTSLSPTRISRERMRYFGNANDSQGSTSSASALRDSRERDEDSGIVYSDRFIPSRNATNLEGAFDTFNVDEDEDIKDEENEWATGVTNNGGGSLGRPSHLSSELARENLSMMNSLLRSELLGVDGAPMGQYSHGRGSDPGVRRPGSNGAASRGRTGVRSSDEFIRSDRSAFSGQNVLRFKSDKRRSSGEGSIGSGSGNSSFSSVDSPSSSLSSFGALAVNSSLSNLNRIGSPLKKSTRKIPKTPYKILDAPALQDDYYLNLVDWSSNNVLSVALGSSVYLWSAYTSKVTKLMDTGGDDSITSICWAPHGAHVAVGTNSGRVQLWDVQESKLVQNMASHCSRVGTLAWSSSLLATGSRDRSIFLQDSRVGAGSGSDRTHAEVHSESNPNNLGNDALTSSGTVVRTSNVTTYGNGIAPVRSHPMPACVVHHLSAHRQEVCGLKWSPDEKMLASGGNDNKLFVWGVNQAEPTSPICRFTDHVAAVKAVAWSPHQNGLLASGGGTADRNIRFWNAITGTALHRVDTGSQVCNLIWSKTVNEIVSTHGYSLNQVIVWRYPSMHKLATLTGHSLRVLYLAMSPDGQSVVTGAGDETLRFWNLFPGPRSSRGVRGGGPLFPGGDIR